MDLTSLASGKCLFPCFISHRAAVDPRLRCRLGCGASAELSFLVLSTCRSGESLSAACCVSQEFPSWALPA